MFPGAVETLQQLRDAGYQLAVATGKGRTGLTRVLEHTGLAPLFDATRCSDETASKPDPEMVLQLLDELDVPAHQAVVIGDTEYDMATARSAPWVRQLP